MSKTVDQRVVEMQFDNKQFERNVSVTMSSVEKLKQSLNFKGAAKGLEDVGTAAKKVDMNGLGSAVETVHSKFSALQVMGVTALANITNSAVNAGKRIVSALTIDPVISGFQEYETQMNAIQTILANTQSKGTTLDDVKSALSELNEYADQTIYNFTEMTRNIGTFTAAGVDLDKSVTSIKGIANLAAVSGSNSQQAATAMYQLSQALAAGKVQLMDWNSVVNAGMGGELFQNALIRTATQMGTNVDALIKKYGSFRESLTKGEWLTAEVLTETLTQLSGAYTKADLIAQGYTEKQAQDIVDLAETAVGAATEVKTFTQLWETMKEAVGSGWAQTWQLIIGDFEEAKLFFTELSEIFGGIIQTFSDARNNLLSGALSSPWDNLTKKINEAGVSTEKFESAVIQTAKDQGIAIDDLIKKHGSLAKAFQAGALKPQLIIDTLKSFTGSLRTTSSVTGTASARLEEFSGVVAKVINGDFKNGEERVKALTDAGYDQVTVQKLVNKIWERNGKNWSDVSLTAEELSSVITDLSAAELESIGFTKEESKVIKDLAAQAEQAGTPINELINNISKPSGRELLLESVLNIINSIVNSAKAVGAAWQEIFPPMESTALYSMIEGLNEFTKLLEVNDEVAGKITRTFRGLFAILDIITTIIGGGFKAAFTVLKTILGAFNLDLLDFTAMIGDAAYNLRNFLLENNLVIKGIQALATGIASGIIAIRKWIDEFLKIPAVVTAIENLKDRLENLKEVGLNALEDLKDGFTNGLTSLPQLLMNVGKNIIAGLQNGLEGGLHSIPEMLMEIGRNLLEAIKDVLGIQSPSTEMEEVGSNVIEGLFNGLKNGVNTVFDFVKYIGTRIVELLGGINWGRIAAAGMTVGLIYVAKQFADAVSAIAAPFEGLGDLLSGAGNVLDKAAKPIAKTIKSFSKILSAKAFKIRAEAIKSLAVSLAILAGSLYLVSQINPDRLLSSVVAIGALATIMGVLSAALANFGSVKGLSFAGFSLAIIGISASLLLIASAVKKLDSLDPSRMGGTMTAFGTIIAGIMGIIAVYGQLVNPKATANIAKVGTMMIALSASLLLMVGVVKVLNMMTNDELIKGGIIVAAFSGIVIALAKLTSIGSDRQTAKLSALLLSMSVSLLLMTKVVKEINGITDEELKQAGKAIGGFAVIVIALAQLTTIGGNRQSSKLAGTLLAFSASLLIMTGIVKIIAGMEEDDLKKGERVIMLFGAIITGLVLATNLAGKDVSRISATLLSMSVSIGILAAIAVVLSLMDTDGLIKGIAAVGALSVLMTMLVVATKFAQDIHSNLIVMTVAIGILAAAVAGLSFIDPGKLAGATAAMAILMGMFALIIKSSANVNASMSTLIVMTAAIAALGGIIYALSGLPIESVLASAASLSTLLLSLSASMVILSKAGKISLQTSVALVAMTAAIAGLAAIMGLLDYMNVEPSIETASALSILLLSLSAACVVLAAVGKVGAGGAVQGALVLDAVIAIIGALVVGLGALVAYFPQMQEFVDKGADLLMGVGQAIGGFVGGIAGGFLSGLTSGLPDVATNLSMFMENLQPFLIGVGNIDADSMGAVKSIAEMILLLTAADIINGIASIFGIGGGASLTKLATELQPFGEAMAAFGDTIKGHLDPESTEAAANAGKMLAELNNSLPREGGLLQDFLGSKSLGSFGEQLKTFGEAIVSFSETVAPGGTSKINEAAVESAANAGKTLASLYEHLPKQGGWLQDFLGEQDLGVFGEQLKAFGSAIVAFSQTVAPGGTSLINEAAVESATNAGKTLASLYDELPRQGGWMQSIFGEQDLAIFGEQLKAFGRAIVDFSNTIAPGGTSIISQDAVLAAANAGMTLSKLAETIPNTGGLVTWFTGDNDMATFGEQLVAFGESFAEYSKYMEDVDADVVTTTTNAADSIVKLANSLDLDRGIFSGDVTLEEFGEELAGFGKEFAEYYGHISDINVSTLSSVVTSMWSLVNLAKGMDGINTSAMSKFGDDLSDLGESGVDGFIDAFKNATSDIKNAVDQMLSTFIDTANSYEDDLRSTFASMLTEALRSMEKEYDEFKTSGTKLVTNFSNGIKSKDTSLKTSLVSTVQKMVESARGEYSNFYSAGTYLVSGFAKGISNNSSATSAARSLARKTLNAMKDELDIHSPSRVIRDEVGNYIVEGLAEGIDDNMSAEDAAAKKAQNITSAFQEQFELLDLADETAQLESELYGNNLDYAAQYERQLKRVELAYAEYQNTLKAVGESAAETQEAYNKYLQEEIDLRTLANEQAQATYENEIALIEEARQANNMSLIEEMAAYKRLQKVYVEGSEQRIAIDSKLLELQNELRDATEDYYKSLSDLEEQANKERSQIDRDYEDKRLSILDEAHEKRLDLQQEYVDKEKEINDQLVADIKSVEQAYQDAVDSRADTLYGSYGLFDSVDAKDAVSAETLIGNLESQINAFQSWTDNINSLASKGIDDALLDELRKMGPSSSAEIEALNSMTDEQLDQYVELWRSKHQLAADQATFELQGMREETNETIEQLKKDAETELEEYRATWNNQMQQLNNETDQKLAELKRNWLQQIEDLDTETQDKLDDLRENWMESVVGLEEETESAFTQMALDLVETLGNKTQWSEAGANMILGTLVGIMDNKSALIAGVEDAMQDALDAANRKLGINSPSKEFAKIGRYSDEGFAQGLRYYSGLVRSSAEDLGGQALNSLKTSIATISQAVSDDIDYQPTIRPVLDLSDIQTGVKTLDTIFSKNQALSASTSMQTRVAPGSVTDEEAPSTKGVSTIQFTQNNYSPKALSRVDIYRQTKNQFSSFGRLVQS